MLAKWLVPFATPVTEISCNDLSLQKSKQCKNGLELPNTHFQTLEKAKWVITCLIFRFTASFHSWNIENTFIFYCYLHSKCSDELQSLVPILQSFTVKIRHSQGQITRILFDSICKAEVPFSLFSGTPTLWNRLPRVCFHDQYHVNHFNLSLSSISSPPLMFIPHIQ